MHEEICVSSAYKKEEDFLNRLTNYYCIVRKTIALELSLGKLENLQ